MCEFCIKHGDGEKWYLNAANYAEELIYDIEREKYIEDFLPSIMAGGVKWLKIINRGNRFVPIITRKILKRNSSEMKKIHFGQVVPLEEVREIMKIVGQVVRLPCVCRQTLHSVEEPACYLLAASPDKLGFKEIIGRRDEAVPFMGSMEKVSTETALAEMEKLEERGMIHTVWTFITPFIGAICNCDSSGCLAVNYTARGLQLFFPGEDVIYVDSDTCSDCGSCIDMCLFGALSSNGSDSVNIDSTLCHGCGICRRVCPSEALSLTSR